MLCINYQARVETFLLEQLWMLASLILQSLTSISALIKVTIINYIN